MKTLERASEFVPPVVDGPTLVAVLAAGFLGPVREKMTRDVACCCLLLAVVNLDSGVGSMMNMPLGMGRLWGTRLTMLEDNQLRGRQYLP